MAYKDAKIYYKLIKDEFSDNDEKLAEFYEYSENTWFSLNNPDSTRYSFSLWSQSGKFNFQGNKKILISENNLKEYINFTNNAVESFNHLLNECLSKNIKVSFNKFEEIIKYIFIKFEGSIDSNIKGYTKYALEYTLISDILRELVNSDF